MKKLIATLAITLSGCSIFPDTKSALLKEGSASPNYCLPDDKFLVESRIEKYLSNCFKPVYINTGNIGFYSKLQLMKEDTTKGTEFSIFSPSGTDAGFFLNVVVSNGSNSCRAQMSATAYNFMWERQFSRLHKSAIGEETSCP